MRLSTRVSRITILALAALLSACETNPAIHRGAAQGARMTQELRQDISAVVEAQDRLYEDRLEGAVKSINELYNEKQRFKLVHETRAFAKSNASTSAEAMAGKVSKFMKDAMKSWAKRHADYDKLISRARRTYEQNRRKVEVDESRLAALRAKFMDLSDSRSRAEAVKFLVAFAKEVRTEIEKQKAASGEKDGG
jgi:hypothetical protein